MEKHLLCITFMLNSFVLLLSFTGVISAPMTQTITGIMKVDKELCDASKFLYEHANLCDSLKYPIDPSNFTVETLNNFLCLGVYDTAYKICQYSSRPQTSFNSTASFNSYMEKSIPSETQELTFNRNQEQEFCYSLQGFKSLYSKTNLLLEPLVKSLNTPDKCLMICFGFNDNLHRLCAILAWIKSVDDINKASHDSVAPLKQSMSETNDETTIDKTVLTGAKRISEEKEIKQQDRKQITTDPKDDNVKHTKSNVPDVSTGLKSDPQNTGYDTEKQTKDQTQKKIDISTETQAYKPALPVHEETKEIINNKPGINTEVVQSRKNANNDPQVQSINNAEVNVPNKEGKAEDLKKKQNIDDLKTSTLSENTQDNYDGNLDDSETGDNINDVDDTIQSIDTGNQNENAREESFEQQKSNLFPNLRTEDDSHFFTYFTVITVACIAGYIGYHNKQKILAIVLEGRRSRSNRGRRRPSTASYRKLDCTLEEAVTSQCNANVTHVIY